MNEIGPTPLTAGQIIREALTIHIELKVPYPTIQLGLIMFNWDRLAFWKTLIVGWVWDWD